jgi:UDP-N-acetylmuramoylalanine--D-glutamate ligase
MDGKELFYNQKKIAEMDDFVLNGTFNGLNILTAALACSHFGISVTESVENAKDFQPLKHRMQFVGIWGGVRFYNDSKATKPDATILALKTLPAPFILILGGSEKGSDFSKLAESLSDVRLVVLHGVTADRIGDELKKAGFNNFIKALDQKEAIHISLRNGKSGDSVLLSPACASYDQFNDFEKRGDAFIQEVRDFAKKILGS